MRRRPSYRPTSPLEQPASNRWAWIASGVVVGALVGGLAAYYLPLLWWYFANGLSDTSGGPTGVEPIPVLAPFGALMGAGFGALTMANRTESLSRPPRDREDVGGSIPGGSGERTAADPGSGRPEREPEPGSPRDRLPLIVIPAMFVALALAGIVAVYGVANLTSDDTGGSAIRSTTTSPVTPELPRAPLYAGLTPDRAAELAGADFATLLGIGSGSGDAEIATSGRKLGRTRCYHSRHWGPYWRVSFAGGSPIFESRRQALVFCNRDPHVIEVSEPIQH